MHDLLFLAHRIPYPPNKGDKIRSWNILRHLARDYRIHLGCFVDDPADRQYEPILQELCARCHFSMLDRRVAKLRSLRGLLTGAPLTLGYFEDRAMREWVSSVMAGAPVRHVFVFSSSMAQYARRGDIGEARLAVDFVDVDSDKWRQYADNRSWPASWIYRRESRLLLDLERRIAATADASLFVSEAEAALFRRLAPGAGRVLAMNNGVDFDYFDPGAALPDPYPAGQERLVFTGAMDYWANVDAVSWFAREVLPSIRTRRRDAAFWIVGANPAQQVRDLAGLPGVSVTGAVPDIRPYIAHATAVVAPLRLARGVQNKVLEAMAMAKTVLATPEALEGIDAAPGEDVLCAPATAGFAGAAVDMLCRNDLAEIGDRARNRVLRGYGWAANLADLKEILEKSRLG